jgi:nucleotide-binding universal stress UspA family protein
MPTMSDGSATATASREQALVPQAFRGILVPFDGSALAEQALSVGAALAHRAGAPLHLVWVEQPAPTIVAEPGPETLALAGRTRAEMQPYLESLAQATVAARPGTVRTAILAGQVPDALGAYAVREQVDLIVLTTHGRGGLARWWLGSVADQLLRQSVTPLLLLHPRELPQATRFPRIMVGLDGETDRRVLSAALAFGALSPETTYMLTSVIEPEIPLLTPLAMYPHHVGPNWDERRVAEARTRLGDLVEELKRGGHSAIWKAVEGRGVADCMLELGRALNAECVVVGTHGLTGIERMVLGSVAAKVLRGAQVPVLVVPIRQAPEAAATQSPNG